MWITEADAPWMPKLVDILYKGQHGTNDEKAYYSKFGISAAEWSSDHSRLLSHKNEIVRLFNERYAERMINRETLEAWQNRLQTIMDTEAPIAEHALALYAIHANTDIGDSETTTYNNLKDQMGGNDQNSATVTDTPDAIINLSDKYADSVSRNSTTYGRNNTRTGSVTVTRTPPGGNVPLANQNMDAYRNIIAEFVGKFEKIFMSIMWY